MMAFLFIFGLVATLVAGGVLGSLHLRTPRVATGRRVSGLQRAYAAPMGSMTAVNRRRAGDVSSHYTRKAFVTSILLLVLLSVLLISAMHAVVH